MISADVKLINAKQKIKRSGSCISKFFIRSTSKCQNMVSSINRDTPCFEIHHLPFSFVWYSIQLDIACLRSGLGGKGGGGT